MKAICTLAYIFFSYLCFAQLPAFPGAEGFGSYTPGGRYGKIIFVTNLDDHGPGSLRAAIDEVGPRIIVFRTGGVINLETKLIVNHPYITIAGQTAPGSGICLRGEGIRVATHDVVIRYLRVRPGDINFGRVNNWDDVDGISVAGGTSTHDIVLDHCSVSWAIDENMDMWHQAHDITIQNCIIGEALNRSRHSKGSHSMGMLIGSEATNISIHHNIFAHNNDRNPHINGHSFVDFRNNIIYNPGGIATDIAVKKGQAVNYVNNYIIPGPDTKITAEVSVRNLRETSPNLYFSGNVGARDNFRVAYYQDNTTSSFSSQMLPDTLERQEASAAPVVTTYPAEQALEYVLLEAGATLPRQDAVDRKIVRDVTNGGAGIVNTKRHLLSWPPYEAGVALVDSDQDGMPDYWEETFGLDANSSNSHEDADQDGYTNIEEYLNGTAPVPVKNDFSNVRVQGGSSASQLSVGTHTDFSIDQNFPNPVTTLTNIAFSLDRPSQVLMKVFNRHGQEVSELINGFLYEGKYQVAWDASTLNKGVYHLIISSEKSIRSIKIMVTQ